MFDHKRVELFACRCFVFVKLPLGNRHLDYVDVAVDQDVLDCKVLLRYVHTKRDRARIDSDVEPFPPVFARQTDPDVPYDWLTVLFVLVVCTFDGLHLIHVSEGLHYKGVLIQGIGRFLLSLGLLGLFDSFFIHLLKFFKQCEIVVIHGQASRGILDCFDHELINPTCLSSFAGVQLLRLAPLVLRSIYFGETCDLVDLALKDKVVKKVVKLLLEGFVLHGVFLDRGEKLLDVLQADFFLRSLENALGRQSRERAVLEFFIKDSIKSF